MLQDYEHKLIKNELKTCVQFSQSFSFSHLFKGLSIENVKENREGILMDFSLCEL